MGEVVEPGTTPDRPVPGCPSIRRLNRRPRTARGRLLLEGMGVTTNDIQRRLTNVSADHLGLRGIDTLDQLAGQGDHPRPLTKPDGWVVLNGETHGIIGRCGPRSWAVRGVRARRVGAGAAPGGRWVVGITVVDGDITVPDAGASGSGSSPSRMSPATLAGLSVPAVANVLAATASGLAIGFAIGRRSARADDLRDGRATQPGRMNIYTIPVAGWRGHGDPRPRAHEAQAGGAARGGLAWADRREAFCSPSGPPGTGPTRSSGPSGDRRPGALTTSSSLKEHYLRNGRRRTSKRTSGSVWPTLERGRDRPPNGTCCRDGARGTRHRRRRRPGGHDPRAAGALVAWIDDLGGHADDADGMQTKSLPLGKHERDGRNEGAVGAHRRGETTRRRRTCWPGRPGTRIVYLVAGVHTMPPGAKRRRCHSMSAPSRSASGIATGRASTRVGVCAPRPTSPEARELPRALGTRRPGSAAVTAFAAPHRPRLGSGTGRRCWPHRRPPGLRHRRRRSPVSRRAIHTADLSGPVGNQSSLVRACRG